jgi:sialic acid synthase SpsE
MTNKAYLIAEVSSNLEHYNDVYDSISIAKKCGADCVKFQQFTTKEMYGRAGLSETNFFLDMAKIKEKADVVGIDFMVSCFSAETLRAVDPYVKAHKIASSELTHPELLVAAAQTGKRIFLSTGASGEETIRAALMILKQAHPDKNPDVVLLYCNAAYPSRYHNLFIIDALRERFGYPVGLSDHSRDVVAAPMEAVLNHGAVAVEKHFKLRDMDTPDDGHSLTSDEFQIMVKAINADLPVHIPTHAPDELDMVELHNRRLIAKVDIERGSILQYGQNIGSFRSLKRDRNGFAATIPFDGKPMYIWISGRTAKIDIKAGDSVGPHNVVIK